MRRLGFTPVDIASLGPGPLRGARQYDRHNLICVSLALTARKAGWRTWGEAYGRFSLMTGDPLMGSGGPDLMLQGETGWCAVELTASAGQTLEEKFRRWDRVLAHPGCPPMDVLWLDASRDHTLLDPLKGLASARPRQHAGSAAVWRDTLACDDGFHKPAGTPPPPAGLDARQFRPAGRAGRLPGRVRVADPAAHQRTIPVTGMAGVQA